MIQKKIRHTFLIVGIMFIGGFGFFLNCYAEVPLIPRQVLFGNPEITCVRVSPDGRQLAYLAPHDGVLHVWISTIGRNDDHPITHDLKRGIREFIWAKNTKHILFTQDSDGDENWHIYRTDLKTQKTTDLTPFSGVRAQIHSTDKRFPDEILITMNKENSSYFDVYLLNLMSGALQLVAKNPGDVDVWLADSNFIVRAAVVVNSNGSTTLFVREDNDSQWMQKLTWDLDDSLAGSFPAKGSRPIRFSCDGTFLFLIDSARANTQGLVKLNLVTGDKEFLAFDDNYDIDSVIFYPDSDEPGLVSFNRARMDWKALHPAFEEDLHTILSVNNGDLTYIDCSSDDMKWVLNFVNDNGLSGYYLYDRQTKKTDFLFYERPFLSEYELAPMKPISFQSRDGLTIHGYLTTPARTQTKNLPMVLNVHGGPWHRNVWGFNPEVQLLANRGYACLQINFRGSTGYGKKFLNAGDKEWAGKMHNDLLDAVNWAVKEGIADVNKIAISGMSYGGYAALVGATFSPDVFRCAVDLWGPSNLITMLDSITSFREAGRAKWYKRVGNPETDEAFLKSRSPLFKVDQIKIPIFVAQGGNDPRIKQEESEQLVEAMKAKGIDYEYMLFPDEGHQIMHPENAFKLVVAVEKFIAKHLGGRFEN